MPFTSELPAYRFVLSMGRWRPYVLSHSARSLAKASYLAFCSADKVTRLAGLILGRGLARWNWRGVWIMDCYAALLARNSANANLPARVASDIVSKKAD